MSNVQTDVPTVKPVAQYLESDATKGAIQKGDSRSDGDCVKQIEWKDKEKENVAANLNIPAAFLEKNRPGAIYKVRHYAKAFEHGEVTLRNTYVVLCDEIRAEQMTPECVTWCLASAGMRKERISEIKRVAFSPKKIYDQFRKRLIGFRVALAAAREADITDPVVLQKLRWNQQFASLERLAARYEPPCRYWSGNGRVLVTWHDKEFKGAKLSFSLRGYRVTVERRKNNDAKPTTKSEVKNDKETGNGIIPAGNSNHGLRISKHKRGGNKLSR